MNIISGKVVTDGESFTITSPCGTQTKTGKQISGELLHTAFDLPKAITPYTFSTHLLTKYLKFHQSTFIEAITIDTGFIRKDAQDLVAGTIELCEHFSKYAKLTQTKNLEVPFTYVEPNLRTLTIKPRPYGLVAALTPQNAPLIMEMTVLLASLYAGNAIVLRPSSQLITTMHLLYQALIDTLPEAILYNISIVSCSAVEFLKLSYQKADLIHYIGSSTHGQKILHDALEANKKALVDGEGTSTVVYDGTLPIKTAVNLCKTGIIRCNGELCSTIRTILVHEHLYKDFSQKLAKELDLVTIGDPTNTASEMGPLFDAHQAEQMIAVSKKYKVIAGQTTQLPQGANYITPILLEVAADNFGFLDESVYGPLAAVIPYTNNSWKEWLTKNPYKITDAVLTTDPDFYEEFIKTSKAPRIVVNHDPSIESVFEPWGAILPSGQNDVSTWIQKYQRLTHLDLPNNFRHN